ncbi:uncharacterized protein [Setaria viridis]|uniref:uncharacterized protein n=1 Tax=Setaria viridis TaxID=4556 RepID=UPI003B3A2BC4
MPTIRGAQLIDILEGKSVEPSTKTLKITKEDKTVEVVPNPVYVTWVAQDQQLLGYLLNSLTKDVLAQVATLTSSAEVWVVLEGMFSAQSHARATHLRMQLASLKKGGMTATVHFAKMKAIGDELATVGKAVGDDEMISFILNGLDSDYNSLVSSVIGRLDMTLSDLYAQIVAFDMHLQMLAENNNGGGFQSSANSASCGRGGFHPRDGNRGRGGSSGAGGHGFNNGFNNNAGGAPKQGGQLTKVARQVCKKPNHEADECWYRFEEDYQPKVAGSATTGYEVDTN